MSPRSSAAKMQYGAQQGYTQHDELGPQYQSNGQQYVQPGNQVVWRIYGFNGVGGRWLRDEWGMPVGAMTEEKAYELPYTLRDVPGHNLQVLSRWNMINQKLTISRKQCTVKVVDGAAILTSTGRGPTGWRAPGGPWNALWAGERHVLADGDQVGLDCNDPEGAVFTCHDESAMQQQHGGYHQQGGYQQQQGGYQQQDGGNGW